MNSSRTEDGASSTIEMPNWGGEVSSVLAPEGYVIGLEIGSNSETVALGDIAGRVVAEAVISGSPGDGSADAVLARLPELIESLLRQANVSPGHVARLGIGFAGPVDVRRGRVLASHRSAGWDDFPLCERLEQLLDLPVMIENDARLAALGESWFGAGQGQGDALYLHWGAGVGSGLVLGGSLYHGSGSTAGEIGHIVVDTSPDAPVCNCGARGHLEAFLSSIALLQQDAANTSPTAEPVATQLDRLFSAASAGDVAARQKVEQAVDLLGIALANQINVLNPAVIIIGGLVGRAASGYIDRLSEQVRAYAMPVAVEHLHIRPAELGDGAIVRGAIALGIDSLRR